MKKNKKTEKAKQDKINSGKAKITRINFRRRRIKISKNNVAI
jgi:hypothetical protein